MSNRKPLYQINNVSFTYSLGLEKVHALNSLTLTIPEHSLITLSGPSGSGKSTLLNLMGLIEPIQEGEILFLDQDIRSMTPKEMNAARKFQIGFIFQQFHLIPVLTAEENVAYFLKRQKLPAAEVKARTAEALDIVGLTAHRKKRPSQMSGGQKQRVAIARALAKRPKVIIGDELTASLDQATGREIMECFQLLVKEHQVSIVFTTHDPMVLEFSDLNFHIQDGALKC